MSESDFSGTSSLEESSSEEDFVQQSSITEAYTNEPLADSNDEEDGNETDDEDGIASAILAQRYHKVFPVNSWCQCGHCSDNLLTSAREFRCCKEVLECVGKFTFEGKQLVCITEHWDYLPLTHKAVLKNVGPLLTCEDGTKYKPKNNQPQNEYLCAIAYRWVAKWLCGYLGWDNSRPLPACIYQNIRTEFASLTIKGYKGATQRQ